MFPVPLIDKLARERGLPYLLIGGQAINAYCEPRSTLDVDFLVPRDDKAKWTQLLVSEGFRCINDANTFVQFAPPYGVEWRLDLMLVNRSTFSKLKNSAQVISCLGVDAFLPSPEHLVALKLHALQHRPEDKQPKDMEDILNLIRNAKLEIDSPSMKEIFERHGTKDTERKVRERLAARK